MDPAARAASQKESEEWFAESMRKRAELTDEERRRRDEEASDYFAVSLLKRLVSIFLAEPWAT